MLKRYPHLGEVARRTTRSVAERRQGFDAIIVGGGATGGLAAQILTEAGMDVLVLDAGWNEPLLRAPLQRASAAMIERLANPGALQSLPAPLIYKGRQVLKAIGRRRQPVQTQCYAWERRPDAFVDDVDNPYETPDDAPFVWLRTRQPGGRLYVPGHGRQYFRFGAAEFRPADNASPRWPLGPNELDPWYEDVERRLEISGAADGIGHIPDSQIAHKLCFEPAEALMAAKIESAWSGARAVSGRYAEPLGGLGKAAQSTRLWCRRGAIATRVLTDRDGRACGVRWHDRAARDTLEARAPVVFLCASALETTRLLMLSETVRAPDGIGYRSGALGRYLMDHLLVKAEGQGPALAGDPSPAPDGRCLFLPRFDEAFEPGLRGQRGYGVQLYQTPGVAQRSWFTAVAFGEMLPRAQNRISLDRRKRDAWGIPTLRIECRHSPEEIEMGRAMSRALKALAELAGATLTSCHDRPAPPGTAAHECGTARMGSDPAESVLNPVNECWDVPGLFVTDASALPSQGAQNPTLTLLALTARACDNVLDRAGEAFPAAERELATVT